MGLLREFYKELLAVQQIGGWACLIEYVARIVQNFPCVIRTKTLALADKAMAAKGRTFKVFGKNIHLDGALFGGAREIYGRKVYFALPDFFLKPTDIVVDLGANAGVFAVLAALLAEKVIAVEAQSGFINEIYSNTKKNDCSDKVSVEFGLVGAHTGVFSNKKNLEVASHFGKMPPILSLGGIIARHRLGTINFLKVDIEGSEFDLMSGDINWLAFVEKLVMEVHLEFGDPAKLVEILQSNGFLVWLVDNNQNIVDRIKGMSGYLFAKQKPKANSELSYLGTGL
ncbi:MAG: FkbM family methyltransferase [Ignavibacteriales bacterium]|nr:FkbM family methyltransferase [Ignavibacteriales bacterium]